MPNFALYAEGYACMEIAFFDWAVDDASPAAGPRQWQGVDLTEWLNSERFGNVSGWSTTQISGRLYDIGDRYRDDWPPPAGQYFAPPPDYRFIMSEHPNDSYINPPERQWHQAILRWRSEFPVMANDGYIYHWNHKVIIKKQTYRRLTYIGKAAGGVLPLLLPLLPLLLLLNSAAVSTSPPPGRRRRS